MGICSKAKDIICCNKIADVPISIDMISKNNEQKNNNINITNNNNLITNLNQ